MGLGKNDKAMYTISNLTPKKRQRGLSKFSKMRIAVVEGRRLLMKRQLAIFLIVSVIITVWGFSYASRAVANFAILYPTRVDVSGTKIVLRPKNLGPLSLEAAEELTLVMQDNQQVIKQRLEQLNVSSYHIKEQDNQLEIFLPHAERTPYVINIITHVGQIEFIDGGHKLPSWGEFIKMEPAAYETYPVLFTGQDISAIIPPNRDSGEIFYQVELQPEAAQRVAHFIYSEAQAYTCLVIDKQIINCSKMYHLAGNTLDILPNLDSSTGLNLNDLAVFFKSGPLPMPLELVTN